MEKYVFEGCCTSVADALKARLAGAARVELCSRLEVGGVTPPLELIQDTLEVLNRTDFEEISWLTKKLPYETFKLNQLIDCKLTPKLNVLVRPRPADFVYDGNEVAQMISDIERVKNLKFSAPSGRTVGVNGVVIGALLPDGRVDLSTMRRLVAAARPLEVTFHRAFDECADVATGLEDVISLGCERLLTSGHEADAFAGRFTLARLVGQAAGRIVILAGCGVRPHNIDEIASVSHAPEYHSSTLEGWSFD